MISENNIRQLITARLAEKSRPGHRSDERHLALAIEGGGMRGVVSAGMVAALEALGMLDCFDSLYGASAGAITGAYFLAGQAHFGTAIFYENINNGHFIAPRRLLNGGALLSLEYLVSTVCAKEKPLDVGAVLGSAIPLHVVAASLGLRRSVTLSDFTDTDELFTALRASACMPVLAGAPVPFRGDHFLDASLYQSIPLEAARLGGATDVVTLLSRPKNSLEEPLGASDQSIVIPRLQLLGDDLCEQYRRRRDIYEREMLALEESDIRILPVQIGAAAPLVKTLEISGPVLMEGAAQGYKAVYRALGLPEPAVFPFVDSQSCFDAPAPQSRQAEGLRPAI